MIVGYLLVAGYEVEGPNWAPLLRPWQGVVLGFMAWMAVSGYKPGTISKYLRAWELLHLHAGIDWKRGVKHWVHYHAKKPLLYAFLDSATDVKLDFPLELLVLLREHWGRKGLQGVLLSTILGILCLAIRRAGDILVPENGDFSSYKHWVCERCRIDGFDGDLGGMHEGEVLWTKTKRLRDRPLVFPIVNTEGLFPLDPYAGLIEWRKACEQRNVWREGLAVFRVVKNGKITTVPCTTSWFRVQLEIALRTVTGASKAMVSCWSTKSGRSTGLTFYAALGLPKSFYKALGDWSGVSWKLYNRRAATLAPNMRFALGLHASRVGIQEKVKASLLGHDIARVGTPGANGALGGGARAR